MRSILFPCALLAVTACTPDWGDGDTEDTDRPVDTDIPVGTEDQTQICLADGDGDGFGGTEPVTYIGTLPANCSPTGGDCDDARATVYPGAYEIPGNGLDDDCAGGDVTGDQLDADPFLALYQTVTTYGFVDVGAGVGCVPGGWASGDGAFGLYGDITGAVNGWQHAVDWFRSGEVYGLDARFSCTDRLAGGTDDRWSVSSPMSATDDRPMWDVDVEFQSAYTRGSPWIIMIEDGGRKHNFCTRYDARNDRFIPGNCAYTFVRDETPDDPYDTQQGNDDENAPAPTIWYLDHDGDTYGGTTTTTAVTQPAGYVERGGDCNDNQSGIRPGAQEIAGNGLDDDCTGLVDDVLGGRGQVYCYPGTDADGDGYSTGTQRTQYAGATCPGGTYANGADCDDARATVYPGANDVAGDGIDQDCSGSDTPAGGGGGVAGNMEFRVNGYGAGSTFWGYYLVGRSGTGTGLAMWDGRDGGVGSYVRVSLDTTVNGIRDGGANDFVIAPTGGFDLYLTGTYTIGQQVEVCVRNAQSDYRLGITRLGGNADNWVTEIGQTATVASPVVTGSIGQEHCAAWTID